MQKPPSKETKLTIARGSAGAILAGGRSSRFGAPKALAELGGRTIIERAVAAHKHVVATTVIVGDQHGLFGHLGLPVLQDSSDGLGPIGGLYTALLWAEENGFDGVVCTPCDAPFVEPGLLRAVLEHSVGVDAVVPTSGAPDALEPLFGWYSCRLRGRCAEAIRRRELAVRHFILGLDAVHRLLVSEMKLRNPPELVFFNVNSPADYAAAQAYLNDHVDPEG